MKTRTLTVLLALLLVFAFSFGASAYAGTTFTDTNDAVAVRMCELGIVNGYPDGTFNGLKPVTAKEYVVALGRLGYGTLNGENWYQPYIDKLIKDEVLPAAMFEGEEIDQPIARQQSAVLLINMAKHLNVLPEVTDADFEKTKATVGDYDIICWRCQEKVVKALNLGYVALDKDVFHPDRSITRFEMVDMLNNLACAGSF
jgi:hypothetical protein